MRSLSDMFPLLVMVANCIWLVAACSGLPLLWWAGRAVPNDGRSLAFRVAGLVGCWLGPVTMLVHLFLFSVVCDIRRNMPIKNPACFESANGETYCLGNNMTCDYLNWNLGDSMPVALVFLAILVWLLSRRTRLGRFHFWFAASMWVLTLASLPVCLMFFPISTATGG